MYSAQDFANGRLEKQKELDSQTSEESYLKQKEECTRSIEVWFQYSIEDNYEEILFESPVHPKLLKELHELGYETRLSGSLSLTYPYKLVISLPQPSNDTGEHEIELSSTKESFLQKFWSSIKNFLPSNKNTL